MACHVWFLTSRETVGVPELWLEMIKSSRAIIKISDSENTVILKGLGLILEFIQ